MPAERRFVLASPLARLIHRERGPADRLIEAHFPARSDRTQLVRVERGRASLILRSGASDGRVSEEAVEVPLSHAEALVEAAAGTVAFDRTFVPLGRGVEAVLDRFILPQGLDLLSVTITGEPQAFALPAWLGPEVTGDEAFEARELAITGLPSVAEVEVTNAALDALLDTLEGKGAHMARAPHTQRTGHAPVPSAGPATATPALHRSDSSEVIAVSAAQGSDKSSSDEPIGDEGELPSSAPPASTPALDLTGRPAPLASFHPHSADPLLATEAVSNDEEREAMPETRRMDPAAQAPGEEPAGGALVEAAIQRLFAPAGEEPSPYKAAAASPQAGTSLPDVEDGPALGGSPSTASRRPTLRANIRELDDGIARLARSLAPRGPRSTQ